MMNSRNHPAVPSRTRHGFTLVEMLVATALVVLMMLMFAQVFQTSAGLVSNQKGMAELDQSVRTLTILLRGDIKQRTFVDVVPYVAGQDTTVSTIPGYDDAIEKGFDREYRRGYFSISENDPNDPTDDVLSLTIRTDSPLLDEPQLPFSGKAKLLRVPGGTPANNDQYLNAHPDQPEYDDGQTTVNSTGSSRYAEVCWFLRNGVLYRRILLIRDPYNRGGNTVRPEDPQDNAGNEFIDTFYDADGDNTPDDDFWRDFDYSAYWEPKSGGGLKFHSMPAALDNGSSAAGVNNLQNFPRSLGIPFLRFGSSISRITSLNNDGNPPWIISGPREYIVDNVDSTTKFIGRYTAQETADDNFGYPGTFSAATDPFNGTMSGPKLSLDASTGLVNPYHTDPLPLPAAQFQRRGQDVVMSNVHEFDIQVWDDGLATPGFVDLGHSGATGYYQAGDNQNTNFGGNTFDTWHPHADMPPAPYAPFTNVNGPRTSLPSLGLGDAGEVWLRAIRIKIRFYDAGSEQMRDLTFTFRLNRENSRE